MISCEKSDARRWPPMVAAVRAVIVSPEQAWQLSSTLERDGNVDHWPVPIA